MPFPVENVGFLAYLMLSASYLMLLGGLQVTWKVTQSSDGVKPGFVELDMSSETE